MKEKRMIKVIGIQKDEKGQENKIELMTEGTCYEKKDSLYIVYEESEISGMEGATTTLKIDRENKVSMRRFGSSDLKMIFQKGKTFTSQYSTQYGKFDMEIFTKELDIQLCSSAKKGSIEIQYDLWISGLADTTNELKIQLI
ncbi:Uncharacterized beta-barrel protein YwiB, DUF1934 family [Natronincola peptidivorans]|uniref:Uncharacterized beta-barrel protein YwiB, DUF1934 family n=1 Tax=Natronincola peptidivorans TaxID=426128 RepID=A0A1I0AJ65_9FIRM|nr:DUF1934 domain-containing protein [Natronincola peptidivorans]SES94348.1 Uncharacterized beta-barrel protein YwiB, DUF1934 family [Natronincola peptidivorans]